MKLKKIKKFFTDDFFYDLFEGGSIKPENILSDAEELKKVQDAISTIKKFRDSMIDKNIMDYC